jgi:hypothetical protein
LNDANGDSEYQYYSYGYGDGEPESEMGELIGERIAVASVR